MPDDSKASEVNHVYILGAGFSYPMGGPLFKELFTKPILFNYEMHTSVDGSKARLAMAVQQLNYKYPDLLVDKVFTDAEHFLELCDSVLHGKEQLFLNRFKKSFNGLYENIRVVNPTKSDTDLFQTFFDAAKIHIAVDTNTFIEQVPDDNDRWKPYILWFKGLGKTDSIVTLNYDLLVETIATKDDRPFPGREFKSKEELCLVDELLNQNKNHPDLPILFKLHGSVDWIELGGKAWVKRYNVDDYFEGLPPLLGTPGTTKASLSKGCLDKVWGSAIEKIQEAHVISIVGYSLPATDNDFRIKLLDSIIGTHGNLKAINIVLGPPTPDSLRARAILEQVTRLCNPIGFKTNVRLLPIYAQDYLPYYRPKTFEEIDEHSFLDFRE
jgi:hypothetical protein